jgi:hypothetical protein
MKLYVHMTEQERRRADRKHEKLLLNLKQDAEVRMEIFDSLSPELREWILTYSRDSELREWVRKEEIPGL